MKIQIVVSLSDRKRCEKNYFKRWALDLANCLLRWPWSSTQRSSNLWLPRSQFSLAILWHPTGGPGLSRAVNLWIDRITSNTERMSLWLWLDGARFFGGIPESLMSLVLRMTTWWKKHRRWSGTSKEYCTSPEWLREKLLAPDVDTLNQRKTDICRKKSGATKRGITHTKPWKGSNAKKHRHIVHWSLGPRWYQTPGLRVFCQALDFATNTKSKQRRFVLILLFFNHVSLRVEGISPYSWCHNAVLSHSHYSHCLRLWCCFTCFSFFSMFVIFVTHSLRRWVPEIMLTQIITASRPFSRGRVPHATQSPHRGRHQLHQCRWRASRALAEKYRRRRVVGMETLVSQFSNALKWCEDQRTQHRNQVPNTFFSSRCWSWRTSPWSSREFQSKMPRFIEANSMQNMFYQTIYDDCFFTPGRALCIRFGYVLPLAPRTQSSQRRCWLVRPRVTSWRHAKLVVSCISHRQWKLTRRKISQYYGFSSYHDSGFKVLKQLTFLISSNRCRITFRLWFVIRSRCWTLRLAKHLWPQRSWSPPPAEPQITEIISSNDGERRNVRFQEISGPSKLDKI